MAVVRARSAPPYALIVTIFLLIVAVGLAVWFYIDGSKAKKDLVDASGRLEKIARGSQDMDSVSKLMTNQPNKSITAITVAQGNLDALHNMVEPGSKSVDELQALTNALLADAGKGGASYNSLSAALKGVIAERNAAQATVKANDARFEALSKDHLAKQEELRNINSKMQGTLEEIQTKLTAAGADIAKLNEARDKAVADSQETIRRYQESADDARRIIVLENQQAKATIAQREDEINQLRLRILALGGGQKDPVGQPDGKIVTVNAAANEVYINLGSKDRVKEGQTFGVYDRRVGVRFGTDDQAQGNGSIEVMSVINENTSRARITRVTPGHSVQLDDLIASPAFQGNKTRKTRFVIYGDFDLDGDGAYTAAERDRLERLVVRGGGQIDQDVSPQTDFLVMGKRPASPTTIEEQPAGADAASQPAAGSVAEQRVKAQSRYDDLVITAKRMSIPVLNDNRFLAMIGYFNTTIVRY